MDFNPREKHSQRNHRLQLYNNLEDYIKMQVYTWALLLLEACYVSSFTLHTMRTTDVSLVQRTCSYPSHCFMSSDENLSAESAVPGKKDMTDNLFVPLSFDEMVRQSASAMKDAYEKGITRQILRILLPRNADKDQLLQYYEADARTDMKNSILVPPDETWQGGIMQLYRAASATAQSMLR